MDDTEYLLKQLKCSKKDRQKLIRLTTSTLEYSRYLMDYAEKHNIPPLEHSDFHISQMLSDWEDYTGKDDSTKPPHNQHNHLTALHFY